LTALPIWFDDYNEVNPHKGFPLFSEAILG